MCEIAVVVVDTIADDFYKNCQCYKAGDVICAQPDGWLWGVQELANPNWRILQFPGIDASAFAQHVLPQTAADPNNPPKTLLRRARSLNLVALSAAPSVAANAITAAKVTPFISDATRKVAALSLPLAAGDIPAVTITKAPVLDPAIIGAQPTQPANVIG